jgi:hypothetical protein
LKEFFKKESKLKMDTMKGREGGGRGISKFWLELEVGTKIFYVLGLHDMEY